MSCACVVTVCTTVGTIIGTPKPVRAHLGSTASAGSGGGYSSSYLETSHLVSSGGGGGGGGGEGGGMQAYHYEGGGGSSTADYDMATGGYHCRLPVQIGVV